VSKCVCGARIGGVRHELDKSNMEDDGYYNSIFLFSYKGKTDDYQNTF
jgi:hypothetical protein